jgi:hypothetical protein
MHPYLIRTRRHNNIDQHSSRPVQGSAPGGTVAVVVLNLLALPKLAGGQGKEEVERVLAGVLGSFATVVYKFQFSKKL